MESVLIGKSRTNQLGSFFQGFFCGNGISGTSGGSSFRSWYSTCGSRLDLLVTSVGQTTMACRVVGGLLSHFQRGRHGYLVFLLGVLNSRTASPSPRLDTKHFSDGLICGMLCCRFVTGSCALTVKQLRPDAGVRYFDSAISRMA